MKETGIAPLSAKPKVGRYFTMTLGSSWSMLDVAILSGRDALTMPVPVLRYLAGLGPMAAALWLLYRHGSRESVHEYWQRLIDATRITGRWWAIVLMIVPLLTGLVAGLDALFGGSGFSLEAAANFTSDPLSVVSLAGFLFIFGPLPEEMGWRGYALDGLLKQWTPLVASLILGTLWTCWHLPLFAIPSTYQAGLGWGTQGFWLYMCDKVPQTIVMTWVYTNTRRSTLSAVLIHWLVNLFGELFRLSPRADLLCVGLWGIAAVLVTLWGMRDFGQPIRAG